MGAPKGKKARAAAKKAANKGAASVVVDAKKDDAAEQKNAAANGTDKIVLSDINATGTLTSQSDSRDLKIDSVTLTFHGQALLQDSSIELSYGNRYGLIGQNGCGKSTFLRMMATREVPIPKWMGVYHLEEETEPTDMTGIETVVEDAKAEVARLEAEQLDLMSADPDSQRLQYIFERLEFLDPDQFQKKAGELLYGLGFNAEFMKKKTRDMSGGWRMRVALAKALFIKPMILLLDEPTNHLDMESTIWLENYLKMYPSILVIVSHSQDFLNNVCTHTIHMTHQQLKYYGGNYDTYVKTRAELEVNQMKHYKKQQEEIKHHKAFIASCGTFSNLVKQAKSRQKILDKMEAEGLIQPVTPDPRWQFQFLPCDKLPPPVIAFEKVCFAYSGALDKVIYKDVCLGMDTDSRIALVGPNGAGKSTLLKLLCGDLNPTDGDIRRHSHLRFARYHQHSTEQLPMDRSCLDFVGEKFPNGIDSRGRLDAEQWRAVIGRYGVTGRNQLCNIEHLSDGQKSRVVFMIMVLEQPNFLLLDEPTNHLDIEAIDALADAIKQFNGGMVLVSHDFRLINQVADEIWECNHQTVKKYPGSIQKYKDRLRQEMEEKNSLVM